MLKRVKREYRRGARLDIRRRLPRCRRNAYRGGYFARRFSTRRAKKLAP